MKVAWRKLLRGVRFHHLRVVHRSRDPHGAAQSFALGVFLGFMPLSVLATILALVIPRRLGWRTIPAVVGTFAGNWITAPFILSAAMFTGRLVTTGQWTSFQELIPPDHLTLAEKAGVYANLGGSFFVGITIVSLAAALVAYGVVHFLVRGALRLRKEKVLERLRNRLHVSHPSAPPPLDGHKADTEPRE